MSTPENDSLAIVVPAYNEEASLGQTLCALSMQNLRANMHIVVDNASTDNTRQVAEVFARTNDGFPLMVIDEPQKGTGSAADTGFRAAVDMGYQFIARTDADTLPLSDWTNVIRANFLAQPNLRLLGGKRIPRRDDGYYKARDAVLWPLGVAVSRILSHGDNQTGGICGNNMATTSNTYEAVGGFPRVSIDTANDDREYELAVEAMFGRAALRIDHHLTVATSMRRTRSLGYLGLARHYARPEARANTGIDVRSTQLNVDFF